MSVESFHYRENFTRFGNILLLISVKKPKLETLLLRIFPSAE